MQRIEKPEILAPAGDRERLDAALLYGADAVYLAGTRFGMRRAPANFTEDELREAAKHGADGSNSDHGNLAQDLDHIVSGKKNRTQE